MDQRAIEFATVADLRRLPVAFVRRNRQWRILAIVYVIAVEREDLGSSLAGCHLLVIARLALAHPPCKRSKLESGNALSVDFMNLPVRSLE